MVKGFFLIGCYIIAALLEQIVATRHKKLLSTLLIELIF